MDRRISISGLNQLSRGLRALDKEAPKALRVGLNDAANLLVSRTVPWVPKRSGRAAASYKARSTRTSARVSIGGNRAPYVPWLDFGGKTGRNGSVVRPFLREGRYLYPTLKRIRPEIEEMLSNAITDVIRSVGMEVD